MTAKAHFDKIADAYAAFESADNAWTQERIRVTGIKRDGDTRFTPEGRGEPGSTLRRLYDARSAAQAAWHAAINGQS